MQQLELFTQMLMRGSRGKDRGHPPPPPLENDDNIEFLNNTGLDSLTNHKGFNPAFNVLYWAIIGPPAKRHLNGVSLADRYWPAFNGISMLVLPQKKQQKKTKKKQKKKKKH